MNDFLITRNIKDRFYTTVAILSLFVPTFLSLNLTDSGSLNLSTTSIGFITLVFILMFGLILAAYLNKEIDVTEAFLYLALFLLSIGLTAYVYGNGYTNKTEDPKDFIINISSICFSFIGSIAQIIAMFYKSIKKRKLSKTIDEEKVRRNEASSEGQVNERPDVQRSGSQENMNEQYTFI